MKQCYGCRQMLDEDKYGSDTSKKSGKSTYCLVCRAEKQKKKRKDRPYVDKYYRRLKVYKVTQEWYETKLIEQNYVCEICGTDRQNSVHLDLYIDHDHETDKVRGLLCGKCNSLLGFAKDNIEVLEGAILYLKKYSTNP